MLKLIGGALVGGLALLGVAKYLEKRRSGEIEGRYVIELPENFDLDAWEQPEEHETVDRTG